jgi:hypothetical protein
MNNRDSIMDSQLSRRHLILACGAALVLPAFARTAFADDIDIVIGEIEKRIMRDYYERRLREWEESEDGRAYKKNKKKKHKDLPPGLAKKGTLPPGLAKKLARNGHLPPGLEYRDLPPDLIVQLPAIDPAYRYVIVDDRVILIQRATNLILDVLTVAALDLLN